MTIDNFILNVYVIMADVWNRAGHYIFILWLLLSIFLLSSFFPRLISAVGDWMSTVLLHMCDLSANLECRPEMCYTRLAGNRGRKNDAKIAIWAPSHNFVGLYLRN